MNNAGDGRSERRDRLKRYTASKNVMLTTGLIYTCVGALAITGHLHYINADLLGWWLAERQLDSGGSQSINDTYFNLNVLYTYIVFNDAL